MNTQAQTQSKPAKQAQNKNMNMRGPLNGVDTPTLFATLDAVNAQRDLAIFKFRATNKWISGTHSRSEINWYSGAGGEHTRSASFIAESDHPATLVGGDNAPTPVEFVLHALAGCLTAGIGNIAAARGVPLRSVESTVEGDINMLGLLGIDRSVRNGYSGIRVKFRIQGDAPEDKLKAIVEQSKARSAVYDILTNGVPVAIDVQVD
jgi:uncharacterized OsmC-like protein